MSVRQLTPEERRERGVKLAGLLRQRNLRQEDHKEASRAHREEMKALDKEIGALARDVENGFELVDDQQEMFSEMVEATARPRTDSTCSVCGAENVQTMVSISSPGKEPTPPACLGCLKGTLDIVRGTVGSAA